MYIFEFFLNYIYIFEIILNYIYLLIFEFFFKLYVVYFRNQ